MKSRFISLPLIFALLILPSISQAQTDGQLRTMPDGSVEILKQETTLGISYDKWELYKTAQQQKQEADQAFQQAMQQQAAQQQAYINREKDAMDACLVGLRKMDIEVFMDANEVIHMSGTPDASFRWEKCMNDNGFPVSFTPE